MIDYKRIAGLLTQKWYSENKLPVWKDDVEYNYLSAHFSYTPYGDIWFGPYYAYTEIYFDEDTQKIKTCTRRHGGIDKRLALVEVWPDLTDDEKTAFMSSVLGGQ